MRWRYQVSPPALIPEAATGFVQAGSDERFCSDALHPALPLEGIRTISRTGG